MGIPSRQIGWGTEENLLWEISKQLENLIGVTYNSKKTLLNTQDPFYGNPNVKAKIETFSGAWSGTNDGTPFLTVDLNQIQGLTIEYSMYSFNGQGCTGTLWVSGQRDGGKFVYYNQDSYAGFNPNINYNQNDNLIGIYADFGGGQTFEIVYTVKLFTLPMYND